MKQFYKIVSLMLIATTMLVIFSITSFASNVTETKNVLESNTKKTVTLSSYGDVIDYKINVSETGKLKLGITSLMGYLHIYVCDSKGKDIKPYKESVSIGDSFYSSSHGYTTTIWNGAMEKFTGSFYYEVEKGVYFIRLERSDIDGTGKIAFNAVFPSSETVEKEVKINYVYIALKKGDSLKFAVSLSDKTNESVKWSSSDKTIATVNSKGKVTGKSKGSVVITAKIGNSQYKIYVQVVE